MGVLRVRGLDAIAALFETDHVTDDRRPGLQMQVAGPTGKSRTSRR